MLNIVYAFDENYNKQAFVSICSLIEKINVNCNIFIIHHKSSTFETYKNKIEKTFKNVKIDLYTFKKENVHFPNLEKAHVSEATYYRLFFDKYVPTYIENFLYLDADVICMNNPINKIQNIFISMDKEGFEVAARKEGSLDPDDIENRETIGVTNDYFNAGVLFVNYKKSITNDAFNKLRERLTEIEKNIKFWDQDVLNSFYNGKFLNLEDSMNYDPNINDNNLSYDKPEKIFFLHYQGSNKPWTIHGIFLEYSDFYHNIYKKYGLGSYHITSTWKKDTLIKFLISIVSLKFIKLSSPYKYITSVISFLITKKEN